MKDLIATRKRNCPGEIIKVLTSKFHALNLSDLVIIKPDNVSKSLELKI